MGRGEKKRMDWGPAEKNKNPHLGNVELKMLLLLRFVQVLLF